MDRLLVNQLVKDDKVEGYLLVRTSDARTDSKGKTYLDMNLADRTGEMNCKMWDVTMPAPVPGTVVKVRGTVTEYNGRLQLRVEKMRPATEEDQVDMSLLVPSAPEKPEVMLKSIQTTVDAFGSEALRKIVREMIAMAGDSLMWFPAAKSIHHAERGGLLHHITSMLSTAEHIIQSYPFLNGDLIRAGVILHDLCKISEMKSDELGNVTDYTRDGLLIGHLVRGVSQIAEAARRADVTGEVVVLLEHMVISHHGEAAYGSPRPPMFIEAEVLRWIDILDARMNEMQGVMERTPPGTFSERIWSLDRRLYHPVYEEGTP